MYVLAITDPATGQPRCGYLASAGEAPARHILDARKFSLPADAEVKKLDIAEPCPEHSGKELVVLGVVGSREKPYVED